MTYVVGATWKAREGDEQRVEAALRELTLGSRAEPGNLFYQAHVSTQCSRSFFIYEQYVDEAAFQAHRSSEHFQKVVGSGILDCLETRVVDTYTQLDS